MKRFLKISENDNVVVALSDIAKGEIILVDDKEITINKDIKKGHKIAIHKIQENNNVIKYGFTIGRALKNIEPGDWVHTHNTKTNLSGLKEYTFNQNLNRNLFSNRNLTFNGYRREDGKSGIRNELWIIPTVGCVNGIGDKIIERFKQKSGTICADSVNIFKHNYGCSQLGDDHTNTKTILGDIVRHPNAGGVLVLGLGCENNVLEDFKKSLGKFNEKRVRFLVAQKVQDEVEEGAKLLFELHENMKKDKREPISLSELKIGLKCGGSDGLSGITANPLVGRFSDFLIAQGGTTVLTEVPEMFGAEHLLMNRARNEEIFDKSVSLINDFKKYFISYNQPIYDNPSPGNKAGGITTLEEKSLGCVQKAGIETVIDVIKYGEILKNNGLNLLSAPGNDLVSSTALGASGCQLVLFTTGRGTPFGNFVPTIKISTNTELYKLKPNWIDFNAGGLVNDSTMNDLLEKFIKYIIDIANGQLVNNEKNNIREISIFKNGVTL
ncbi:altronate dehydratase [Clostridium ragsdalei P11]|uniref:Altronate dehydratase n=1 Tax=Clostridium ragsdalei P11 TaxID=1353534 RepID=A0A1A6AQM5_9CLOT|nr:altronate dehydratase family protein [Clostridium ragsdalei]OBR92340.1 altronate dehydratase [Clostridium ragsdalei P11]